MVAPARHPTTQLQDELCKLLRAGAYEHVAAELVGVPYRRYKRWLQQGRSKDAPETYRNFVKEVRQAKAHARFMAESELRRKQPRYWLLHGPGRETEQRPGWTAPPRLSTDQNKTDAADDNVQNFAAVAGVVGNCLQLMPPARITLADQLFPPPDLS